MQRILSVETSRSSGPSSEFVSKKLCCSFLLTVTFFAVVGGFLLGRFVADRSLLNMRVELTEISKKLVILDNHLKDTFHDLTLGYSNCSLLSSKLQCEHLTLGGETSSKSVQETLDVLNSCFNYG